MTKVRLLVPGQIASISKLQLFLGGVEKKPLCVGGNIALIQSKEATVVVDLGVATNCKLILDALAKESVSPQSVTHLVLTQHGFDHSAMISMFPNAKTISFPTLFPEGEPPLQSSPQRLTADIQVAYTPGYTDADISLLVDSPDGRYGLSHLWWPLELGPVDPGAKNAESLEENRKKIACQSDWIVPGHGAMFAMSDKMKQRFRCGE